LRKEIKLDLYSKEEEKANVYTHGFGVLLSLVGTIILIYNCPLFSVKFWSSLIFGSSLLLLYTASTLYHLAISRRQKFLLKKLDHIAIYILIAGTFTPFAWAVLGHETLGKNVLLGVWLIAVAGLIFKIFFTGKYEAISLISYLGMGWIGYIMFDRLGELLPPNAVELILYGGACYTGGVIFYLWNRLKYHHAIWHIFVLSGSAFHFMAIYLYVLPFN